LPIRPPHRGACRLQTPGVSRPELDAASGRYNYVWKTDKPWANTCRQLILNFNDGSVQRANFKFTQ